MKNTVKLFLIQSAIAIVIFSVASFFINKTFLNDPNAMSYLSLNEEINKLSNSSTVTLDSLIKNNELTFDPSNGNEIDKVLLNLKKIDKKKILIIGSSQMIVISGADNNLDNNKRFNTKLEYLINEDYQTYNLSMGAMTTGEKLIVADKAISILNPEYVIIALTPWDSVNEQIRENIQTISSKTYISNSNPKDDQSKSFNLFDFPIPLNEKITFLVKNFTKDNLSLYGRRTILQQWLKQNATSIYKENTVNSSNPDNENLNYPEYWYTKLQSLSDITGWESQDVKSGTKSLKIVNLDGNNALWIGDPIYLDKPTKEFEFKVSSKAYDITQAPTLYCLYLGITFEDGTEIQYFDNLSFDSTVKGWQEKISKISFEKNVIAIRPLLPFYGGKGTVLFDDISIIPYYNNSPSKNIAINPGAEVLANERKHVSYLYTIEEWQKIQRNTNSIIDYLYEKQHDGNMKSFLLITPFWQSNNKKAYPQIFDYEKFLQETQSYSRDKNVKLIDASNILSSDNFGPYKEGDEKGKTDVLHFDENGHNKLAQYLMNELNL